MDSISNGWSHSDDWVFSPGGHPSTDSSQDTHSSSNAKCSCLMLATSVKSFLKLLVSIQIQTDGKLSTNFSLPQTIKTLSATGNALLKWTQDFAPALKQRAVKPKPMKLIKAPHCEHSELVSKTGCMSKHTLQTCDLPSGRTNEISPLRQLVRENNLIVLTLPQHPVMFTQIISPNMSIFTHFPEEPRHQSSLRQAINQKYPKDNLEQTDAWIQDVQVSRTHINRHHIEALPLPSISHGLNWFQTYASKLHCSPYSCSLWDALGVHPPEFPQKKEKELCCLVLLREFYNPASTLVLFVESLQTDRVWTTLYAGYL